MALSPLRLIVIAFGGLMILGGLVALASGSWLALVGLWSVVSGLVIVAVAVLERQRYRSSAAEAGAEVPGPGGGEPLDEPLEPRFRPTTERFVDPTSGQAMRVWLDPASGERRYRADG
jgi:hypothetical protein